MTYLVKTILYPILPDEKDREKFLLFLKTVTLSEKPIVCVITGAGCSGKSTLAQLATLAVGQENVVNMPPEVLKEGDLPCGFSYHAKLACLTELDYFEKFDFGNIAIALRYPEKLGFTRFLVQGYPEQFPDIPESGEYIHIHLDNKISTIHKQCPGMVYDIIHEKEDELQRQMVEWMNTA